MSYAVVEPISGFAKRSIVQPRRREMKNQLNRRDFIKLVSAAGGGLVLAVYLDACASDTPTPATVTPAPLSPTATPRPAFDWAPNFYLKLNQDGILTIYAFRSEMGQG